MKEKELPPKEHNSIFRRITDPIAEKAALGLTKIFPGITADNVTNAGFFGVYAGATLSIIPKGMIGADFAPYAVALMAGGTSLDALDGTMARLLGTASTEGALLDMITDRKQEMILALARIATASMRKDTVGVIAATAAGISNPIPSKYRAMTEELGYYVPESGARVSSFFGTRPIRALLGISATAYPEAHILGIESPMQPILDSISVIGNVFASMERAKILGQAKRGQLKVNPDPNAQELGRLKSEALSQFIKVNTVLMLGAGTVGLTSIALRE